MTNLLTLRRAQESDVNQIYWLRRRTFEQINAVNLNPEIVMIVNTMNNPRRILEKIQDRDAFCLIKSTDEYEEILGIVDIKEYRINEPPVISGLFVRHGYLRKGCGTLLMDFIENYAKEKGAQKVKLSSTRYARNFYLNRGYKPQVPSTSTLTMEKKLR